MKIVKLVLGIIVGLVVITRIAELIEFAIIKLVSGKSFSELTENQSEYFLNFSI